MKCLFSINSWILLATLLLVSACSKQVGEPLNSGDNILAFGDSLTYGVGAGKGQDYPAQLAELTGLEVNNYGISGETTGQGLKRFAHVLAKTQPELVILLEGGNDILRGQNLEQTKQNLSQMIKIANQADVQVLLIGVPSKSLFLSDAALYGELAEEHSVIFIADLISDLLKQPQYKSDAIHLNSAGYQVLAKKIQDTLLDAGLISH